MYDERIKSDLRRHGRPTKGRLLWCALVALFAVAEGAHRVIGGSKRAEPETGRRGWLEEAKTQASIATSYALMAKAMLH